jgi:predicted transcriptional regulator
VRAWRGAFWLNMTEAGAYCPATNRMRRYTTGEIAELHDVPERTVRHQIAEARARRERIAHHA